MAAAPRLVWIWDEVAARWNPLLQSSAQTPHATLIDMQRYRDDGRKVRLSIDGGNWEGPFSYAEAVQRVRLLRPLRELKPDEPFQTVSVWLCKSSGWKVVGIVDDGASGEEFRLQRVEDTSIMTDVKPGVLMELASTSEPEGSTEVFEEPESFANLAEELLHPAHRAEAFRFLRLAETAYEPLDFTDFFEISDSIGKLGGNVRAVGLISLNPDQERKRLSLSFRGDPDVGNFFHTFRASLLSPRQVLAMEPGLAAASSGVKVHAGYLEAYAAVRAQLLRKLQLEGLDPESVEVDIAGHSVGGAMATLAAVDFKAKGFRTRCVTFASPRVGNTAFKMWYESLDIPTARFVLRFDVVPHVPLDRRSQPVNDGRADYIENVLVKGLDPAKKCVGSSGFEHVIEETVLDKYIFDSVESWARVCKNAVKLGTSGGSAVKLGTPGAALGYDLYSAYTEAISPHLMPAYRLSLEHAFGDACSILARLKQDPCLWMESVWLIGKLALAASGSSAGGWHLATTVGTAVADVACAAALTNPVVGLAALGVTVVATQGATLYKLHKLDKRFAAMDEKLDHSFKQVHEHLDALVDSMRELLRECRRQENMNELLASAEIIHDRLKVGGEPETQDVTQLQRCIKKILLCVEEALRSSVRISTGEKEFVQSALCLVGRALSMELLAYAVIENSAEGAATVLGSRNARKKQMWAAVAPLVHKYCLLCVDQIGGNPLPAVRDVTMELIADGCESLALVQGNTLALDPDAVEPRVEITNCADKFDGLIAVNWLLKATPGRARSWNPAAQFLRGLFLLSCGRSQQAISEWDDLALVVQQKEAPDAAGSGMRPRGRSLTLLRELLAKDDDNLKDTLTQHPCAELLQDVGVLDSRIISASRDGAIGVYQLVDAALRDTRLRKLQSNRSNPRCMAVVGRHVCTVGSGDWTISVQALGSTGQSGACLARLKGHMGGITSLVSFSGLLYSASEDKTVRVWSLSGAGQSYRCVRTLRGHGSEVRALAAAGGLLYSGSMDGTIRVWALSTAAGQSDKCLRTLLGHSGSVNSLASSGGHLYSGSMDKTIKVWALGDSSQPEKYLRTLSGHIDYVPRLVAAGSHLYSACKDGTIKVLAPGVADKSEPDECVRTLTGHKDFVQCFTLAGDHLYSGSKDGSIKAWALGGAGQPEQCLHTWELGTSVNCLALWHTLCSQD